MSTLNKKINLIWYGSCEDEPCEEFDLTTSGAIVSVHRPESVTGAGDRKSVV